MIYFTNIEQKRSIKKMRYFLRASWQDEYEEVTKKQYIRAERDAGFGSRQSDEIATVGFSGHGVSGKINKDGLFPKIN